MEDIIKALLVLLIILQVCLANNAPSQYPTVDDGNKMIVISAVPYANALTPFIHWKNRKGIQTALYEFPAETGGDDASALKAFIRQRYDEDTITYILLVGDAEDVPSLQASGGLSDPSFTLLVNDDIYFDAFVGRFSVETEEHARIMVNKVLQYEMKPDPDGEWYNKACGIASNEGNPFDWQIMDTLRDSLLANGFSEVDRIYDPDALKDSVFSAVNDGRGWINYIGHGSVSSWAVTYFNSNSVDSLNNPHLLPIIISYATSNGDFSGKTCFAEAWTRCGIPDEGRGALAFFGFTIHLPWQFPPMDGWLEVIRNLTRGNYCSLGAIFSNGMAMEMDTNNNANLFKTWTLFGDPSLLVHSKKPTALSCSHPETIGKGEQKLSVTGEDSTQVCLYSPDNKIHQTAVIKNDSAHFTVTVLNRDSIYVTGIMQNRIPYLGCIIPDTTTPIHFTEEFKMPKSQAAFSAFQNPGNSKVNFRYIGQRTDSKQLDIFTLDGRMIFTTNQPWIKEIFTWNCETNKGKGIPPGVYCAVLQINHKTHLRRLKTYISIVR